MLSLEHDKESASTYPHTTHRFLKLTDLLEPGLFISAARMSIVFPIGEPAFRDVSLLAVTLEVEEVHQRVLILSLSVDDLKSEEDL